MRLRVEALKELRLFYTRRLQRLLHFEWERLRLLIVYPSLTVQSGVLILLEDLLLLGQHCSGSLGRLRILDWLHFLSGHVESS